MIRSDKAEELNPAKKHILCSRSFGKKVSSYEELSKALASYVSRAAEKLRCEKKLVGIIIIFISTNRFSSNDPQYRNSALISLPSPTADTGDLIANALLGLKNIYRPGYRYHKAGVLFQHLSSENERQDNFFSPLYSETQKQLHKTIDKINFEHGSGMLFHGAMGFSGTWKMKSQNRSPAYTTRWDQLVRVS
jgi:DNA polymerase V